MFLMVEKCIREGISHSIHRYAKANNKYIKDYDKNKEPSYLQYWDTNNLYGWAMLQKLPVNAFEWIKDTSQFNENFIKNCNEESDEEYFFKVDVQYIEKLHELPDLPSLPERMKNEKVEKLEANLHDKTEYVICIRNLKQALNHGLTLKRVHRVINFNQNAQLKPYTMNTNLRKKAKNDFECCSFLEKLWKMSKNRDIKLVTIKSRRNYLVSLISNYHRTKLSYYKVFHRKFISNKNEKKKQIYF